MPSPNLIKVYAPEAYYHIYNRGVDRQTVFRDDQDYRVFLSLLKRYLSGDPGADRYGRVYEDLSGEVELLAYCLMPSHVHLLIYQIDEWGMTRLLRRVMTGYSMYFNERYSRVGGLFQDRFKASLISDESYLWHISRYIHLNPGDRAWRAYPYSSSRYYLGELPPSWVKPNRILELHDGRGESYAKFVSNYAEYRASLEKFGEQLAG